MRVLYMCLFDANEQVKGRKETCMIWCLLSSFPLMMVFSCHFTIWMVNMNMCPSSSSSSVFQPATVCESFRKFSLVLLLLGNKTFYQICIVCFLVSSSLSHILIMVDKFLFLSFSISAFQFSYFRFWQTVSRYTFSLFLFFSKSWLVWHDTVN